MKTILFIILCLTAVFAQFTYDEGVVVLDQDNFENALEQFEYILIEFYAPWCGHCKKLAPEYAFAAQQLAASNSQAKLAKVDCNNQIHLCDKYGARSYPTLKFFVKATGLFKEYKGERTAADIVNWVRKRTEPTSIHVTTVEDAEKLRTEHKVACVFFGPQDSEAHKNFLAVSSVFEDVFFGHADEKLIRDQYNVQGEALVLFKQFDEGQNVLSGSLTDNEMIEFIKLHKYPLVPEFDQPTAQRIFGENKNAILLFKSNDQQNGQNEEAFRALGTELKGRLIFSIVDVESPLGTRVADYLGVTKNDVPTVRIVQPEGELHKYLLEGEITSESLRKFTDDFFNARLTAYLKSQDIPAEAYEDNVRVVVAKNFKEIVLDETKDVLIEYYAPWCGHCKKLAPVFASLGSMLKNSTNLVVAKMDLTANEVQGLYVNSYPTILLYQKGSKHSPIDFDGDRFEEGIIDFLREHTTADLPPPASRVYMYYKKLVEIFTIVYEEVSNGVFELITYLRG